MVSPKDSDSIHMLLAEGVGDFSIQGWYDDSLSINPNPRWVPQIDPDKDGFVTDTNFVFDGTNIDYSNLIGLWYRHPGGFVSMGGGLNHPSPFNESAFNNIPGLGRAFKFTFTIYDSKGVFPEGKVFSHIVYLD